MVEYLSESDAIFDCLADKTRRDILDRLHDHNLTVGEVAQYYDMSLAAVSKHIKKLERAGLVSKTKRGRQSVIKLHPEPLHLVHQYLTSFIPSLRT